MLTLKKHGKSVEISYNKWKKERAICLKEEQIAMGYVRLCVAYPREDCQFEVGTECQDALYVNPFKG